MGMMTSFLESVCFVKQSNVSLYSTWLSVIHVESLVMYVTLEKKVDVAWIRGDGEVVGRSSVCYHPDSDLTTEYCHCISGPNPLVNVGFLKYVLKMNMLRISEA